MSPVRPLARLEVRGFCNAQRARPMRVLAEWVATAAGSSPARRARHATKTGPAWLFDEKHERCRPIPPRRAGPAGMLGPTLPASLRMSELSARLSGKRLYIADLAARLEAMEDGGAPMNALAYRLYARRMATAMRDYPPGLLAAQLGRAYPSVLDAIESRRFETDGVHGGPYGKSAGVVAAALLRHLERQRRPAR